MDKKALTRAYRNAWILVVLAAAFAVAFFTFALRTNHNAKEPSWDMGGVSFVPASSQYGNGYYSPVVRPEKGDRK